LEWLLYQYHIGITLPIMISMTFINLRRQYHNQLEYWCEDGKKLEGWKIKH